MLLLILYPDEMNAFHSNKAAVRLELKRKEQLLVVKAKQLLEEEERLRVWENELREKQEALYWRECSLEKNIKMKSNELQLKGISHAVDANGNQALGELTLQSEFNAVSVGTTAKNLGGAPQKSMEFYTRQAAKQSAESCIELMETQNKTPVPRPRTVATVIRAKSINLVANPRIVVPDSYRTPRMWASLRTPPTNGGSLSPRVLISRPLFTASHGNAQRIFSTRDEQPMRLPIFITSTGVSTVLSTSRHRPNGNQAVTNVSKSPRNIESAQRAILTNDSSTGLTKERNGTNMNIPTPVESIIVEPLLQPSTLSQTKVSKNSSPIYSVATLKYRLKIRSIVSECEKFNSTPMTTDKPNVVDICGNFADRLESVLDSELNDEKIRANVGLHNANVIESDAKEIATAIGEMVAGFSDKSQNNHDETLKSNVDESISKPGSADDQQRLENVSVASSNVSSELLNDATAACSNRSKFTDWLREKTEIICKRGDTSPAVAMHSGATSKETYGFSVPFLRACSSPVKYLIREKIGCVPKLESSLESSSLIGDSSSTPGTTLTPEVRSLSLSRVGLCDRMTDNEFVASNTSAKYGSLVGVNLRNILKCIDPMLVAGFSYLCARTFEIWKAREAVKKVGGDIDDGVLDDSSTKIFRDGMQRCFNRIRFTSDLINSSSLQLDSVTKVSSDLSESKADEIVGDPQKSDAPSEVKEPLESTDDPSVLDNLNVPSNSDLECHSKTQQSINVSRKRRLISDKGDSAGARFKLDVHSSDR